MTDRELYELALAKCKALETEIAEMRMASGNCAVWTCTDHAGHYPVGVASVVVAETGDQACDLLNAELVNRGLKPGGYSMVELRTDRPRAVVLNDGNY